MNRRKRVMTGAAVLWSLQVVHAQAPAGNSGAIQAAVGLGVHAGKEEQGLGVLYTLGYQQPLGGPARWRLNPQVVGGEFSAAGITDTPDQFYRTTSAGLTLHHDLLKYRALAVVLSGGAFATYARGLLGTGGELQPAGQGSRYFSQLYWSGSGGMGLRVSPAHSRLAYEFRPLTLQGGTNGFFLGYATVGVEVKLHQ